MSQNLSTITTIEDLRVVAQKRVPRMFYDYADSGAWTESTYRANESDFQKIKFRQRVAVDMDGRSLRTTMIGQDVMMPVALAPTGLTGMQHADGEMLAAQAANRFGVPFTLMPNGWFVRATRFGMPVRVVLCVIAWSAPASDGTY